MKKLFLPILVVLAILLAACGSNDDPALEGADGGGGSADAADHNDQDVAFAQGMIPHHEQAIEMSDMVIERGESAEVKALAEQIKEAQAPEIETLRGWLEDWGEPEAAEAEHGGGHGASEGAGEMTMMSGEEMAELEEASGGELDRMFLEMMIRHHEGAIAMAQTELEAGQYPEAKEMAQVIIDTQQEEIDRMADLLETLGA